MQNAWTFYYYNYVTWQKSSLGNVTRLVGIDCTNNNDILQIGEVYQDYTILLGVKLIRCKQEAAV